MTTDKRNNILLFAIPFMATFIVYLLTVCRTVFSGDSGEFSLDIPTLGIAHPPGYPLLMILGKLFLILIPGNVAFLLNIFSALLASIAAGIGAHVARNVIFPIAKRGDLRAIAISTLAAAIWGYSNALWATAVGIEVYSLAACLFLLSHERAYFIRRAGLDASSCERLDGGQYSRAGKQSWRCSGASSTTAS